MPSKPTLTWVEQFGRVIVEAQASGAVVAAYTSGSIAEVAGSAGLLTEVGEEDKLASWVADLLDSPVEFAALRDRGLKLARERSWGQVAAPASTASMNALPPVPLHGLPGRSRRQLVEERLARSLARRRRRQVAGHRPFAAPLLRRGGGLVSAVEWLLDTGAGARRAEDISEVKQLLSASSPSVPPDELLAGAPRRVRTVDGRLD